MDQEAADEKRQICVVDEADAAAKADECQRIKAAAQEVLNVALPGLENAVKVLKNLKVKDIQVRPPPPPSLDSSLDWGHGADVRALVSAHGHQGDHRGCPAAVPDPPPP